MSSENELFCLISSNKWKEVNEKLERLPHDKRIIYIPVLMKKLSSGFNRSSILNAICKTAFDVEAKRLVVQKYLVQLTPLLKNFDTMFSALKVVKVLSGYSTKEICEELSEVLPILDHILSAVDNGEIQDECLKIIKFCCSTSEVFTERFIATNMISVLMRLLIDSSNKANICQVIAMVMYRHPELVLSDSDLVRLVDLLHLEDEEVVGASLNLLKIACHEIVPEILYEIVEAGRLVKILHSSKEEETKLRAVQLIDKLLNGDDSNQLTTNFIDNGVIQCLLGSLECSKLGKCSANALITLCRVRKPSLRILRKILPMDMRALIALGEMAGWKDMETRESAINLRNLLENDQGSSRVSSNQFERNYFNF